MAILTNVNSSLIDIYEYLTNDKLAFIKLPNLTNKFEISCIINAAENTRLFGTAVADGVGNTLLVRTEYFMYTWWQPIYYNFIYNSDFELHISSDGNRFTFQDNEFSVALGNQSNINLFAYLSHDDSYYKTDTNVSIKQFDLDTRLSLRPCKLKGLLSSEFAWDNRPHYADECGMWDSVNNIFYGNANPKGMGAFTVSGNKIGTISAKKKISYLAYATSNNQLVYPKRVYFANSNNTLKLVYERPTYDIHIINLAINTKLGNADKVSEIKFTNNLNLRNLAYNDNVVDVTYSNNFKTYEFLVQNDNNDTFTCYIANAFFGENSKVYCYGDFIRCFMNCSRLTTIPVSNFETSNVTSMYMFFEACTNAKTIDVSNFNTSNVTSMFCMFRGCKNVTELKVSNFNTSKLTSIAWMFNECNNVTELDVSNFDTSRCTSMYALFQGCNKITELDVSHFDTGKVTDMYAMFTNCIKLESLDVSNFDTSNVTSMRLMFTNLRSIKRLDISNFNISSVTNLNSFIRNCYELEYLKLPILNTLKVIDCSYMFHYNPKLISLNLNSFSTNNCKNIVYLFDDSYSLRRIFANTLDTSSLENYTLDNGVVVPGDYNVFIYNRALKGGNGTTYDANHIDSEYARIDGENGLPGYFTDPADAIKITLINVDNEGYTDEIYLCAGDTYTIPALDGYTGVITDNNSNTYSVGDNITIPNSDITLTFVWSVVNNN